MKSIRALIVEDNEMNADLARFVLEKDGFDVVCASSAADAQTEIATRMPDMILMDIQMPDMNGLELTKLLRANPRTRDIVIVAFTASAMPGDEERMRAGGCDGYISKPIDIQSFAAKLRTFAGPQTVT